ncbi:MAG TPA: ornithine carbamoyltransferase [Thermodesulfobacteriota bacterium]|nr:ornithine carbamoyltransferase [Thermodesulfobacteriota bacterium]
MKKDLLSIYNLSREEIDSLFVRAKEIKKKQKKGIVYQPLLGKTLGMVFEKPSTRTRVSFEVGMYQLGGHAIYLRWRDTQLGRGETIGDTARTLSRYLNCVMIRTFSQETIEEFARYATIPVINGLTDSCHPCQILSDVFTIIEKKGTYQGLKVAYIGDGNNIAHSWIDAALRLGFDLTLACPAAHQPDRKVLGRAQQEATSRIEVTSDPSLAAKDADVISTDTWVSMGQETEYRQRIKVFKEFQVNTHLLTAAKKDVVVMHCLPAHRGEEITDEVMDGAHSIIFDQAENRLHLQKAILVTSMEGPEL